MNNMLRIGFIGGGKMAQAMAKGFISAGLTSGDNIIASCLPSDVASVKAFKDMGAKSTFDNIPVVEKSEVILISVKPSVVPSALSEIKKMPVSKLFLSIAMGVTIKHLEQLLPADSRVVRVMPNNPALVNKAASVFVNGSHVKDSDVVTVRKLLESIGTCEQVSEDMLDAITALSGSGPAYVYVFIEALADGGVKMGLPRDLAYRLASQTVLGAGQMVQETNEHPAILKDNVSSPAGSTITGLHYLEKNGFRGAVIGAIEAATKRCQEVSRMGPK